MLTITVPGSEFFDDSSQEFVTVGDQQLELEHSLVSLSKWESFWEKPFLGKGDKTSEEVTAYIQCMCLTPNIPPEVFARLSRENLQEIDAYINAKMTASWIQDAPKSQASPETVTSELVYYWMISLNIPFQCETWHLERLFALVKVVNHKNTPVKKRGRADIAGQRRALNEQRQKQFGSTG